MSIKKTTKDDPVPVHRKFGYDHHMERQRIREHLIRRGWDAKDVTIEFRVSAIQERIARYKPTFRERQQKWLAEQAARRPARTDFDLKLTREELEHLVYLFGGANDPVSASIAAKAQEILNGSSS